MNTFSRHLTVLAAIFFVATLAGCGRDAITTPALAVDDPVVFDDNFGDAVDYQAFSGSQFDAVSLDYIEFYSGSASLKVNVPEPGYPNGTYAGGAFTTWNVRDLSGYNALTFYAKASRNATLDVAGLGNDNTGTSLYDASRSAIPLTTDWQQVIIPIPDSSKLTDEGGLFYFAEGHEMNLGFTVWFDEVEFKNLSTITNPRPQMTTATVSTFAGGTASIEGTQTIFDDGRADVLVSHMPAYFDFTSTDDLVATVVDGEVLGVGGGTATITAKLDTVDVTGAITATVVGAPAGPATAPTHDESDVVSLYSDEYADVDVETWHADWTWSTGDVTDFVIDGDNVKVYTDLNFAGIIIEDTIDCSEMTHFHMDVWAPEGTSFLVKLIDFGADGTEFGGDDVNHELTFNAGTTPAFVAEQWSALEIPLTDFTGLVTTAHIAQLVISSPDVSTAIVDNVYFHK